ncbi:helix-turn-helix domain-containing protein [Patescibacteria group bacterium]|nr:helix-turn-helix domain-containing protein [Patescibacteria group bacterium]
MTKNGNDLPKLLRIKEAADMLSVHPATLRRWDEEGELKAVRIGSRSHPTNPKKKGDRRYQLKDIKDFIEKKHKS